MTATANVAIFIFTFIEKFTVDLNICGGREIGCISQDQRIFFTNKLKVFKNKLNTMTANAKVANFCSYI